MVVAWVINHLKNGFFIFRPGEGWEYVMTLTALGLVVATLGPGESVVLEATMSFLAWGAIQLMSESTLD